MNAIAIQSEGQAIDAMSARDALSAMLSSQVAALSVVQGALDDIDAAARLVADAIAGGSRLYYAAAGSSGLMALADASELPGTFGVAQDQIRICMAGGVPVDAVMPGETEDDTEDAVAMASQMRTGDIALVLSASGTTPFAIAFATLARAKGVQVIAIANTKNAALLDLGDVAIALPTDPEVVQGSTRLGAGTAQKVTLNMISTQAGVLLGHVHDGRMVNLQADNIKLRKRAIDIVMGIAHVPQRAAERALTAADQDTKLAVLLASGVEITAARAMLHAHNGRLHACFAEMDSGTKPQADIF